MASTAERTCGSVARRLLALAVLALAGCASPDYSDIKSAIHASANVERRLEQINGRYILGATDQIQLIIPNTRLSGTHTIRPDGYITLEMIGDFYIEGMTPMQAADALAQALKKYILEADVTIRVTGFNSKKYYLFGETAGVGEHPFTGDVTVLSAFGRARGVTNRAAWDRIRLIRATKTTRQIFKINLADIVKSGKWDTNIQLQANDVLYVPPTWMAKIGYFIDNILFPFRSLFGGLRFMTTMGGGFGR